MNGVQMPEFGVPPSGGFYLRMPRERGTPNSGNSPIIAGFFDKN